MDAMTAILRDPRRAETYIEFLRALADYLQEKTKKHLDILMGRADAVDAVLVRGLGGMLGRLDRNDLVQWGLVLMWALELRVPSLLYDRLFLLSPWRGLKLLK